MTIDLTAWITELGIPESERKMVLDAIGKGGEATAKKIEEMQMRQSDFSRRSAELDAEKKRLETDYQNKVKAEEEKTTSFENSVGEWKKDKEKVLQDAIAAREAAETKIAAFNAKVKDWQTNFGIPDSEVQPLLSTTAPARVEPARNPDSGQFVSKEDFNNTVRMYAKLPAVLIGIRDEHESLFGKAGPKLDTVKLIADAEKSGRTLIAEWESQFQVPERRAAIAKEQHDSELKAAKEEGATAERSRLLAEHPELGVSASARKDTIPGSPVLARARAQAEEARKAGTGPLPSDADRGVRSAIQAFNEGKYRTNPA